MVEGMLKKFDVFAEGPVFFYVQVELIYRVVKFNRAAYNPV